MKEEILDILKNADGYISGERISEMLNVSRTAIWKHIKSLRESGYKIESVTNKGYRLISSPDIITESGIKSGLTTDFIGHSLFIYDETDTTNNRAKESNTSPDGSVFIAEVQTHGKGSRGRGWTSPRGIGIWHSILLKPEISPLEVSQITLVAGLAVCKAIGLNSMIKWPNDIVIDGKKICSLGLRIRKGCSFHGLAFNINMDLNPFHYINPCGYAGLEMCQLADFIGKEEATLDKVSPKLIKHFAELLGYNVTNL